MRLHVIPKWLLWVITFLSAHSMRFILASSIQCGFPPFLTQARLTVEINSSYPIGTLLPYECNAGYERIGSDNLARCVLDGEEGKWHLGINCWPVSCGDPGEIENGVRTGENWTHPNAVQYTCNKGYVISTNITPYVRHCQASRRWSGMLPSCLVVNCSAPDSLSHGSVMYHDVTYGSKVIYDCGLTRKIQGNSERECLQNGDWSGSTPSCVEIECDVPPLIYSNGEVEMLQGIRPGDKLKYKCNDGTVTLAACLPEGSWFPPPPTCLTGETSTARHTITRATPPSTTPHPRRKNLLCRWRVFRWICNVFS